MRMFRKRQCCIGDHAFRGRSSPYWPNMCWDHYACGFFPPMDPAEIARFMSEPSPFDLEAGNAVPCPACNPSEETA